MASNRKTGIALVDSVDKRFVDHPAPSVGLVVLMIFTAIGFAVAIPFVLRMPPGEFPSWFISIVVTVLVLFIAVLCLAFWLLYTTYYIVDGKGITVKYGPSTRAYRWEEFKTMYWRNGLFATKIGRPSVTPCVRLSNAVALRRTNRWWALYLTPNDPKAFIEKVTLFAPELTREMIV